MGAVPSFVTVFSGSSIEASLVLSFLESHGIAAQIEGEHMGVTAPYAGAGGGAGAVKVNVPANDAAEAQEILANRTRGD